MLRPNLKFEHCMNTSPLFCMPGIKSNAKLKFIIEKKMFNHKEIKRHSTTIKTVQRVCNYTLKTKLIVVSKSQNKRKKVLKNTY